MVYSRRRKSLFSKVKLSLACIAAGVIVCLFVGMFWISVGAISHLITIHSYENQVMGTVTEAEYEGKYKEYITDDLYETYYTYVHYVITFDDSIAGSDKYEYVGKNVHVTYRNKGERYLICFNDISNPAIIDAEDLPRERVILVIFVGIVVALSGFLYLHFRKR